MSDALTNAENATVVAAQSGVTLADKALDAVVLAKLGPAGPYVAALIDEGADALKAIIAKELPVLEQHLVADVESAVAKLGQKIAALFHHAAPVPVEKGSPIDLLSDDDLRTILAGVASTDWQPNNAARSYAGWASPNIVQNLAGIRWKAVSRGLL